MRRRKTDQNRTTGISGKRISKSVSSTGSCGEKIFTNNKKRNKTSTEGFKKKPYEISL